MESTNVALNQMRISAWAEVRCCVLGCCQFVFVQGAGDLWRREGLWSLDSDGKTPTVKAFRSARKVFIVLT